MKNMIAHVDADCFYVSAERVRRPHLRGVPVAVLGNHGACIIAKSYELKADGVTTGMPIWEAKRVSANAVYIKRDFEWYESLSRRMLATVQQYSSRVEYYSVDEMFFLVAQASLPLAREVQQAILQRVGVPASIGIAATKTLAKLVSDSTKPFGHGVVADEPGRIKLLRGLPVTEVTGIAERSRQRLQAYGITTCDQFVAADRRLIRRLLTKRGEDLWWELRGESVIGVACQRPRHQNVARGGSLGRATTDPQRLWAFVTRNVERLTEALRHYRLYCDKLVLDLSFRPSGRCIRRASLPRSSADFATLLEAAHSLLKLAWHGEPVHYMHVIAVNLRYEERQQSLWDQPTPRQQVIDQLRHEVNQKVGRFALRSGATTPLADVYSDPANAYDICDIHGKSCF